MEDQEDKSITAYLTKHPSVEVYRFWSVPEQLHVTRQSNVPSHLWANLQSTIIDTKSSMESKRQNPEYLFLAWDSTNMYIHPSPGSKIAGLSYVL